MQRRLKRMLIAIEGGRSDEQVVETALDLAADEGADVVFVHVVSIPGESMMPTGEVACAPGHATNEVLVKACELARSRGLDASAELLIGYPACQIALLADELDVDLIVVGSRRLSALKRAVLGRTSRALIGESDRRVLVVPLPGSREPTLV